MHLIDLRTLREFWRRYPEAETPLRRWYGVARRANWASLQEVRTAFPHADATVVKSGSVATIFNICGNKFRLITAIHYNRQKIFLMMVLTHHEYDKDSWKAKL
ncbi:MAG TPA: type II toxin-antitoxin system HigB family toxin [Phycisphaerae bacterium]|nr:type II toxin-antitoxin system HigB family toxin [Phycisphaerae bacterium]